MSPYAESTAVSVNRSRDDIERLLTKEGATAFAYGWDWEKGASINFIAHGRQFRWQLPMPDRASREFTRTPTGKPRSQSAGDAAYTQAVRAQWRALLMVIKAKFVAIEAGITTFDEEFLAQTVVPETNLTVAQMMLPTVEAQYKALEA